MMRDGKRPSDLPGATHEAMPRISWSVWTKVAHLSLLGGWEKHSVTFLVGKVVWGTSYLFTVELPGTSHAGQSCRLKGGTGLLSQMMLGAPCLLPPAAPFGPVDLGRKAEGFCKTFQLCECRFPAWKEALYRSYPFIVEGTPPLIVNIVKTCQDYMCPCRKVTQSLFRCAQHHCAS